MSKLGAAFWGGVIGAAGAAALGFLLGPARDTVYDERYQSRLDFALAEGNRAAAEREQQLLVDFKTRKLALRAKTDLADTAESAEKKAKK